LAGDVLRNKQLEREVRPPRVLSYCISSHWYAAHAALRSSCLAPSDQRQPNRPHHAEATQKPDVRSI